MKIDIDELKYLNYWSKSLLEYAEKLETYLYFWQAHMPDKLKQCSIHELSGLPGDAFFDKRSVFSLEMIVTSVLQAKNDSAKLIYDPLKIELNSESHDLIKTYKLFNDRIRNALDEHNIIDFYKSLNEQLQNAKLMAKRGIQLTTLPDK